MSAISSVVIFKSENGNVIGTAGTVPTVMCVTARRGITALKTVLAGIFGTTEEPRDPSTWTGKTVDGSALMFKAPDGLNMSDVVHTLAEYGENGASKMLKNIKSTVDGKGNRKVYDAVASYVAEAVGSAVKIRWYDLDAIDWRNISEENKDADKMLVATKAFLKAQGRLKGNAVTALK